MRPSAVACDTPPSALVFRLSVLLLVLAVDTLLVQLFLSYQLKLYREELRCLLAVKQQQT